MLDFDECSRFASPAMVNPKEALLILACHPERSFAVRNAVEGSDYFLRMSSEPICDQVLPARVIAFDESILLRPPPALQLFLPRDRITNVTKMRAVNKIRTMIILREARNFSTAMLRNAYDQIIRHA